MRKQKKQPRTQPRELRDPELRTVQGGLSDQQQAQTIGLVDGNGGL